MPKLAYTVLPNNTVHVERVSPLTGKTNGMVIPITPEQLVAFCGGTLKGAIQTLFPTLTANQLEFLKTGYTTEDWEAIFGKQR